MTIEEELLAGRMHIRDTSEVTVSAEKTESDSFRRKLLRKTPSPRIVLVVDTERVC